MGEQQYLDLVKEIIENGDIEESRNGYTKFVFGIRMKFSLSNGEIPVLTSKKMAWKTCLKELLWFISGDTNIEKLWEQGVHIWDKNAKDGKLGPIYGYQWRNFNDSGIDQLQEIIDILKDSEKRKSRRILLSAWNPQQLKEMALPPCHVMCQFNVDSEGYLSCCLFQRSGDIGLGVPFNILSYSLLTHLLAKHCGLLGAKEFIHFIGNAHIYEEHEEALKEQCKRELYEFPRIEIKRIHENINEYVVDDFELIGYKHSGEIKMEMKA
jgi:thymidylate synthase